MEIKLNNETIKAINILESHGYLAYVVGGYIRDLILNVEPHDVDLLTDATLEEVRFIFSDYKIVDYKKNSLTLGVIIDGRYLEISTFDGKNLEEDLANRDFTINAIAYSKTDGIIDPYGGINDINDKIIKTINDPIISLCKSPIRIIRAIYFSIIKEFKIDKELKDVILTRTDLLSNINPARYKKFLDVVMLSKKPSLIIEEYFEVFCYIFPHLKNTYKFNQNSKFHNLDVFEHTMKVLDFSSPNLILRYAAFFHDIEKPSCYKIDEFNDVHYYNHNILSAEYSSIKLKEFNYSKEFILRVYNLVLYHDIILDKNPIILKKFLNDFGTYDLDLFFELKKCNILGQNQILYNRLNELDEIKELTLNLSKDK